MWRLPACRWKAEREVTRGDLIQRKGHVCCPTLRSRKGSVNNQLESSQKEETWTPADQSGPSGAFNMFFVCASTWVPAWLPRAARLSSWKIEYCSLRPGLVRVGETNSSLRL